MNVGDYVKTNDRGIRRIGKIIDDIFYTDEEDNLHQKGNLIKSSPNIIDLIEENDLIKYRINGDLYVSEVEGVPIFDKYKLSISYADTIIFLEELDIVSVVTREQFSQMEYMIGE